jgi:hypothetical protein
MNPVHPERFRRLKRTVAIGDAAIFGWLGFLGGYMSLKDGDSFGWFAIGVGVAILVLPFTAFFRTHLDSLASRRGFPAIVLLPNLLLIVMFGSTARLYLRDPFLTYNDADTLAAIVFGGAALLAGLSLVANAVAFYLDLRSGTSQVV